MLRQRLSIRKKNMYIRHTRHCQIYKLVKTSFVRNNLSHVDLLATVLRISSISI